MKNHYVLRIYDLAGKETAHEFVCTKSQMDKVFFALAFASANSTISRADLFRVVSASADVKCGKYTIKLGNTEMLENTFRCKGGFECV